MPNNATTGTPTDYALLRREIDQLIRANTEVFVGENELAIQLKELLFRFDSAKLIRDLRKETSCSTSSAGSSPSA